MYLKAFSNMVVKCPHFAGIRPLYHRYFRELAGDQTEGLSDVTTMMMMERLELDTRLHLGEILLYLFIKSLKMTLDIPHICLCYSIFTLPLTSALLNPRWNRDY